MNKFFRCISFILFIVINLFAAVSCIKEDRLPEGGNIASGDTLPDFAIRMCDGNMLETADLKGRVSVLVFFHTDCPDCQKELPVIEELYKYYQADSRVSIVCISREESRSQVAQFWDKHGMSVPYSAQSDRYVYSLFARQGIPRVYISDASATVYAVYTDNPMADYERLQKDVEQCLRQSDEY